MTTNDFADLPSLEELRKDLIDAGHSHKPKARRTRRLGGRRTIAVVAAVLLPTGAAVATMSASREDEKVKWISAAQGEDPSFGRYEIFRDADNGNCFGISLPDQDPPGVARAIAASCVADPKLHASFIRSPSTGVLAYGVTANETHSVELSGGAPGSQEARLFDGPAGVKYFVVSSAAEIPHAQVTALDANGRAIAQQTAPE